MTRNARRVRNGRGVALTVVALFALLRPGVARAETDLPTASLYGGVGLLDMRTARFMPDGYLSFSGAIHDPDDRIAGTFQVFPWAEVTFRYSINYAAKAPNNPQRALYDRSFDLKIRLSHETDYFPELAVGLQDIIGTGVYAGEYLVATKRFGPFDATLGLGWGRLASCPRFGGGDCSASIGFPNPLGYLAGRFKTRAGDSSSTGGTPLFNSWFHGKDVGLFGGIEYTTPIPHLKVQVEYSSDRYLQERQNGHIDFGFPVNFGLSFRFWEATDVGIAFMHGRTVAAHLTFMIDPGEDHSLQRLDQPPRFRARDSQSVAELNRTIAEANLPPPPANLAISPPSGNLSGLDAQAYLAGRSAGQSVGATAAPPPPAQIAQTTQAPPPAQTAIADPPYPPWRVQFIDLSQPPPTQQAALQPTLNVPTLSPSNAGTPPPITMMAGQTEAAPPQTFSPPVRTHRATSQERADAIAKIRQALDAQEIDVEGVSLEGSRARVVISNMRYRRDAEAVARVARVLSAQAPLDIETFEIATWRDGMPLTVVTLSRAEIDRLARWKSSPAELWHTSVLAPAPVWPPAFVDRGYPRFSWSIYPVTQEAFFDPDNPVFVGVGVGADGSLTLLRGLSIDARVSASLWDNFDDIRRKNDSLLPHVRTDGAEYLKQGRYGITDLMLNYRFKLTPETYMRLGGGYLEDMYGGFGGEILYRPFGQRWALGADVWAVKQRSFDRLFEFRDYNTITGHVTLYYQMPWHGLEMRLSAGRYLARDWGATFELVRRFDTGVEIGGWFTLTNVPFSKFGEGSFDKGIRITIPLEWMIPFGTQSSYTLNLRPIQRDGGQRIYGDQTLYDMVESSDYGAMMSQWRSVFRP